MRIHMFPEFSTRFASQEHLYRYLYGGCGVVTLLSPSGESHTYSYEKPREQDQFPEDVIFVYVIHSDSGKHTKYYLGMIEDDKFRITKNSRFLVNSHVVKGALYIEKLRKSQELLDTSPMSIFHLGVCGLCGSKIWSSKSLECGFGRKCRKEMKLPNFNVWNG